MVSSFRDCEGEIMSVINGDSPNFITANNIDLHFFQNDFSQKYFLGEILPFLQLSWSKPCGHFCNNFYYINKDAYK